VQLNIQ